jgi:two-component system, cell cycle sensor histidine kinase and response regulator CckA
MHLILNNIKTILVVEDEPSVLKMVTTMLERLGYVVLAANNASEAIYLVKKSERDIDLVLTDVIMPDINGRRLAEILKAIKPKMKFIFMSGYTADIMVDQDFLDESVCFIQKPFTKKRLAEKIQESLDER